MNMFLSLKTIRFRITLWHLVVLTLSLALFIVLSHVFLWKQLDIQLKNNLFADVEVMENFLAVDPEGNVIWRGHQDIGNVDGLQRWIEIVQEDGRVVYRNFTGDNPFVKNNIATVSYHQSNYSPIDMEDGTKLFGVEGLHQLENVQVTIRIARSEEGIWREMEHLLLAQALCIPLVLFIAWSGGYLATGRALVPLQKIIEKMQVITAEHLHERLEIANPGDELGQLSLTFNAMLEKLDHSFERVRRFTADASHELRTPLAAIRSVGEVALSKRDQDTDGKEAIAMILEEVERMSNLVEELLIMARADNLETKSTPLPEDLGDLVRTEIELFGVLAEEKNLMLHIDIPDRYPVFVDKQIFRLAIGNILHNAIKFTPEGDAISISMGKTQNECTVSITDSGPGIAQHHYDKIFERFYRVDSHRSREIGGTGLGLAIAKWSAEMSGGTVELESSVGHGSTFLIRLPSHNAANSGYAKKDLV